MADINQWSGPERAAFLATSLKGQALTVLSNLPSENRNHYPSLVAALESRYGSRKQAELHRMKLRSRLRRRDESLPELVEDIERLAKLAYPEASVAVLDTLTKDQFIDALTDDELRLRVAQARPSSLAADLGVSLEIESFTLAAKRRTRYVRTVQGSSPEGERSGVASDVAGETVRNNNEFLSELKSMTCELRKMIDEVSRRSKSRENSPSRAKRRCWTCDSERHVQRECPTFKKLQKVSDQGNEMESGRRGGARQ